MPHEPYLNELNHDNPIISVIQFLETIEAKTNSKNAHFFKGNFIAYRGQSSDLPLIPSAFRGVTNHEDGYSNELDHALVVEPEIYREFRDRARGYNTNLNLDNPWEVICFAQHFDVPTRLLDWTINPLTALYFALSGSTQDYAVVWCLNISQFMPSTNIRSERLESIYRDTHRGLVLSDLASETAEFSGLLRRDQALMTTSAAESEIANAIKGQLIVLQPPDIDYRVKNQGSLFSVHLPYHNEETKFVVDHGKFIKNSKGGDTKDLALLKLKIPAEFHAPMLDELWDLGITPYFIYPDLQGLGQYMKQKRSKRFR